MLSGMMAFIVGVAITTRFAELPSLRLVAACLPLLLPLLASRSRAWRCLACALLGCAWGCWRGQQILADALPATLEGVDVAATVCVEGLPLERRDAGGTSWRFRARLLSPLRPMAGNSLPWRGADLQLTSYAAQAFHPGERWRLVLRLRAPRGMVNPGGFDHQAWLLGQGIGATGYVVTKGVLQPQRDGDCVAPVDRARAALRDRLATLFPDEPRLGSLLAASLGDGSRLSPGEWNTLARTGTTHLLVVSGMHISLVAMLLWRIAVAGVRRWPRALLWLPDSAWGAIVALPGAAIYTALAGFGVPAARSLLMLTAFIAFALLRRALHPWLAFVAALLAIVAAQPLAVLQTGFWLSFLAVAALLLVYGGRLRQPGTLDMLWRPQCVVLVALAAPLLLSGQATAPLSPFVNALAIPLVNLVSVPFSLLGCVLLPLDDRLALPFLQLSLWSLDALWFGLEHAARWSPLLPLHAGDAAWWQCLLAAIGVLWLLAPAGFPARALGVLLLLPLALPLQPPRAALDVLMLDVGQGTAVVLRTRSHVLVYDTGPRYSERFDAGADILVPALHRLGVASVDLLVVSHSDGDHAGGVGGLLAGMPVQRMIAGEEIPGFAMAPCRRGAHWIWDGVRFEVLHPGAASGPGNNDHSCVLRVVVGTRVLLLTGDIEAWSERHLLATDPAALAADLLLVPHHGSRTSSTAAFVAAVHPQLALVSAGYRNRFGHPHPQVVARYRAGGAHIVNTADAGAVWLELDDGGGIRALREWRREARRYWFASAGD